MMSAEVFELNAWKHQLQQGERGVKRNLTNLMLHLQNLPSMGKQFRFNDLTGDVEWRGEVLTDSSYIDVRLQIEAAGYQPTEKDLPAAIVRIAEDNRYNPVADYLNSLKWDGKRRIDTWLQKVFGVDNTALNQAFSAMFLISAVARALVPGIKVDTMLILEGVQGLKKSTAIQTLFGKDYVLNGLRVFHGQEAGIAVQGRWAVDLGELSGFSPTNVRDVKHFLSLEIDNYRPMWGRAVVNRPRRVVFTGSTNEYDYLRDPTGARRFWGVACRKVDIELLRSMRDQLWAEAVMRYSAGDQWWIERDSPLWHEANVAQSERYAESVFAPAIEKYLNQPETRLRGCILVGEILSGIGIGIDKHKQNEAEITNHLTHAGWRKKRCMRHGLNLNWWFPPGGHPDD
jgi:predicted P-loop ATPase